MFNIGFKICKVFNPQEFTVSGENFMKQDLILDLGNIRRIKGKKDAVTDHKSTSILISLFGAKIQSCDFKIGDFGSIVGAYSQVGNKEFLHLRGIRFKNPTYSIAYQQDGMKMPPEDFSKKSFEFVLSELHKIKLAQEKFDLFEFFRAMNDKIEGAMGVDETCRFRTVIFLKNLPRMILAGAADVDLFTYLLDNGLNMLTLCNLKNEYANISSNDETSEIKFVESVHYRFIGLTLLEIERKRIQRQSIFFQAHEMRWFDFEEPIHFGDNDFLYSLRSGFLPDVSELALITHMNSGEFEGWESSNTNPNSHQYMSAMIENEISPDEMSFDNDNEWCVAEFIEEQKLKEERDLLEHPPFDDDELDEWNGIYKPDY